MSHPASSIPGTDQAEADDDSAQILGTSQITARQAQERSLLDPLRDGWPTEAFAQCANERLERLMHEIDRGTDPDDLAQLMIPNAMCVGFDASRLQVVFDDSAVQVLRFADEVSSSRSTALPTALRALVSRFVPAGGSPHVHFKVIDVQLADQSATTRCVYEADARGASTSVQQSGIWECRWDSSSCENARLATVTLLDFEEVQAHGTWLIDYTQAVVGQDPSYQQQFAFGLNHWLETIERAHGMDDSVRTGLAVGDVNGDQRDDVYVCQGPGLPNRLLVQNPDGTVTDRAAEAGVDWLDNTASALLVDLDNDGDQDLAVGTTAGLLIMSNSGDGQFELRARLIPEGADAQSLTAADFDKDGDLDLFLCNYRPVGGRREGDFVFHDAITGGRNYLLRNDGIDNATHEWTFTDVTEQVGLNVGSTRYSLAAAWCDYDDDADLDLYVANDYGRNYLYRNEGGTFVDATADAGLVDVGFGMSVHWGDADRDGWMDLYVGNMFSSAGSRITRQPRFQQYATDDQRAIYQRMAQGNSLFLNGPGHQFRDVSLDAGVWMGRWAWSSVFADINRDGWEDLVVANGYITTEDTGDL